MINISTSQTLVELEKVVRKLEIAPFESLLVPTDATPRGMFARAMLIQAIASWARRSPSSELLVYTDFDASENLTEKIIRREHGLVAALMAARISSNERRTDQTSEFKNAAINRLRQLQVPQLATSQISLLPGFEDPGIPQQEAGGARRGSTGLVISADALGPLAFPRQLYTIENNIPTVRSADEFGDWLLAEFTHQTKGEALKFKRPNLPRLRLLGRALSELFSNTHKFARSDLDGSTLARSVRGILTDAVKDAGQRFDPSVEPPAVQAFLQNLTKRYGPKTGVIEISVFDSGPGLAQHWFGRRLGANDRLEDEHLAVSMCLQKWGTRGGHESRGLGLHTVMEILSSAEVGGMLFIRTGRLALVRDLHAQPLDVSPEAAKDINTYSMVPMFGDVRLARIEGTLLSLVIPAPLETTS